MFQKALALQMDNGMSFEKVKEEEKKENLRRKLKESAMKVKIN